MPIRVRVTSTTALALLVCAGCCSSLISTPCGSPTEDHPSPELAGRLEAWRVQYELPALGAAIVHGEGELALAAVGRRTADGDACVTADDPFHLGSCTKAMTATLLGALVEGGVLGWDSSLGEVFPDLSADMSPAYREATLAQLLAHRAGLPDDRDDWRTLRRIDDEEGTLTEKRLALLQAATAEAPVSEPGAEFRYANAGYTIAAAMAERVTGQPYETLMRDRVFGPLEMISMGFGAPGSADAQDAPWGHDVVLGCVRPIAPGPLADNPPFTAPAGGVHCSLADWSRFALAHLRGAQGAAGLLQAETFAWLHTPIAGTYAAGWDTANDPELGPVLVHDGSNTYWYAAVCVLPDHDAAVMVVANRADDVAIQGVATILDTLAREVAASP